MPGLHSKTVFIKKVGTKERKKEGGKEIRKEDNLYLRPLSEY